MLINKNTVKYPVRCWNCKIRSKPNGVAIQLAIHPTSNLPFSLDFIYFNGFCNSKANKIWRNLHGIELSLVLSFQNEISARS